MNAWLGQAFPAGAATAVRIADHVLTVECAHSIVLQELQLRSGELKAFVAAECPFADVGEIRLVRGAGGPGNALAQGNPPA